MNSRAGARLMTAACLVLGAPFGLAACSGDRNEMADPAGRCPATPVDVVVSVDQWGDIVSALGGDCAEVTTVLASSSVDPHDYEPAPKDAATFESARLVVINGGHYDEWAAKLAQTSATEATVIDAREVSGAGETNPHVWYRPSAVTAIADTVTAELRTLAPDAAGYFDQRRTEFSEALKPYDELIDSIKTNASGKTYAATESVFDDMASALGLANRTPQGYQTAAANESDPSPADLDAFLRLLDDRGVDVLIYNVQTEGSVPQQIRGAAEQSGVPVVEITETVPADATSFESWQVDQLKALAEALGAAT